MNYYQCSNGEKVSQATIDNRRSKAYKLAYQMMDNSICEGCEKERAQGSSHIVSQQRCKHLHKTELIWLRINFFPASHNCNSRWESNDTTLKNYKRCMAILEVLDPEGYTKRIELTK